MTAVPRKRKPKIIYRHLGNEWAWGQAHPHQNPPLIEIDPRLGAKRMLEVICHEALHIALPDLVGDKGEAEIDRLGKAVSDVLWRDGYRKVLVNKHETPVKISRHKVQKKKTK